MIEFNMPNVSCKSKKCPVCGKELIIIDNMNYFTLICRKCHTTVFEEFDGNIHKIKCGIMKDGYNASLDIFMKSLMSDTITAYNMNEDDRRDYYENRVFEGHVLNCGIYQTDIFEYFKKEMNNNHQKMKSPCIYFDGYQKYLDIVMEFKDEIAEMKDNALEVIKNR